MEKPHSLKITKSDFLLFCQAPRHLWAKKHGLLEELAPSDFDRHLMEEGNRVEALAYDYLKEIILPSTPLPAPVWDGRKPI